MNGYIVVRDYDYGNWGQIEESEHDNGPCSKVFESPTTAAQYANTFNRPDETGIWALALSSDPRIARLKDEVEHLAVLSANGYRLTDEEVDNFLDDALELLA